MYTSGETGQAEVYVRPLVGNGEPVLISSADVHLLFNDQRVNLVHIAGQALFSKSEEDRSPRWSQGDYGAGARMASTSSRSVPVLRIP